MSESSWYKSSYSAPDNANCVEVSRSSRQTRIRDTKHRDLGHLVFPNDEWARFLRELRESAM